MNTKEEDIKSQVRYWFWDCTKEIMCEWRYQEFRLEEEISEKQ